MLNFQCTTDELFLQETQALSWKLCLLLTYSPKRIRWTNIDINMKYKILSNLKISDGWLSDKTQKPPVTEQKEWISEIWGSKATGESINNFHFQSGAAKNKTENDRERWFLYNITILCITS